MREITEIESYSQLANIVNPYNISLDVVYHGPSGDLKTALLTTNSDIFYYVDLYRMHAEGSLPVYERLKDEAAELVIKDLEIHEDGDRTEIAYTYSHINENINRERKIRYQVADAYNFWPPELEYGFDVLITRGEAQPFIRHDYQLKHLSRKMHVGGHFISDRKIARYLQPHWIGFREIPYSAVFPRGPARVYRKVRQEDESLLADLFMFDDAVFDVISYIRGGNTYSIYKDTEIPDGFCGDSASAKKRFESELAAKYIEVCKIYRKLPEKIKIEALPILLEPEFSPSTQPEAHDQFRQLLLHI